jgi:hypothetical protein
VLTIILWKRIEVLWFPGIVGIRNITKRNSHDGRFQFTIAMTILGMLNQMLMSSTGSIHRNLQIWMIDKFPRSPYLKVNERPVQTNTLRRLEVILTCYLTPMQKKTNPSDVTTPIDFFETKLGN